MSRAGLSFTSTMFSNPEDAYAVTTSANTPLNPAASMGTDALQQSTANMALMGQQARQQASQFEMPGLVSPQPLEDAVRPGQASVGPQIFYDVSGKRLSVNGMVVDANDYTGIAQSMDALQAPPTPPQEPGDWRPISLQDYEQVVSSIVDPSRRRLFAQNFATGIDSLKQLGGSALQLAGFEETGGGIVERAEANMARREIFARDVTEVSSGGEAVDWFVSVLGQQGPIVLESVAAAIAGGFIGTKVAGPGLGTAGGTIAGLFGRKEFKDRVLDIAAKKREGKQLSAQETATLRSAAGVAGATIATVANNYAIGAGDIYGEMREQGVTPDDNEARLIALAGAVPYAAASSLPEFLLAGRAFGLINRAPLPAGATPTQRGTEYLKRFGGGAAVVGTIEGLTETAQEALVLGLSGQDLGSDESVNRLINALAAGAAVGGTLGGVASLRSGRPVNLVKPTEGADPAAATLPPAPPQSGGYEQLDLLGELDPIIQGEIPAGQLGEQGVLDLGGIPETEAIIRSQPAEVIQPAEVTPPVLEADPRQGALQFGQPAPEEGSFGRDIQQTPPNQLQQELMRIQQERAFIQREEETAQQAVAQRDQGAARMERTNRLAQLEQQLAQSRQVEVEPARAAITPETQPEQLPLFAPRETPRPTRAERLRAGAVPAQPVAEDTTIIDTVPEAQMELPSIAPAVTEERAKLAWDERRPNNIKRWENLTDNQKARWAEFVGAGQANALARKNVSAVKEGMALPDVTPTVETIDAAPQPTETTPKEAAPKAERLKKPARPKPESVKPVAARTAPTTPPQMTQTEIAAEPAVTAPTTPPQMTQAEIAEEPAEASAQALRERETLGVIEQRLAAEAEGITVAEMGRVVNDSADGMRIREAVFSLIGLAMESQNNPENVQAREFLLNLEESNPILNAEFARELQAQPANSIDALITRGESKGTARFAYAMAKKLEIVDQYLDRFKNVPEYDIQSARPGSPEGTTEVKPTRGKVVDSPVKSLADELKRLVGLGNIRNRNQRVKDKEKLEPIYAQLSEEDRQFATEMIMGTDTPATIADFFNEDGTLKQHPTHGRPTFTDTTIEDTQQDRALNDDAMQAIESDPTYISESTLDMFNDLPWDDSGSMLGEDSAWGKFKRLADSSTITKPIAAGRVRLLVKNFVAKLGVKPKVHVFKNQADMARKNPQLYERASASRPQGDFDTAAAVGFSFGDGQVIIFSDRVGTEQQLQFVLAHETLGHFGFRGLVSESQLDRILDKIYEENQDIRQAVDMAVDARGLSRREATEEYLADTAAMLETNILARFWNAIKNALNKLGVQFDDDIARYLVSQSRAYVRHGQRAGNFFDNARVAQTMYDVEFRQGDYAPGRFATSEGSVRRTNEIAGTAAQMGRDTLSSASDYLKKLKAKGVNVRDVAERILNDLTTMTFLGNENRGYDALYKAIRGMTQRAHKLRNTFNNSLRELLEPSVTIMGTKMGRGMTKEQVSQTVNMANISSIIKASLINESKLRSMPDIIDFIDGQPVINEDVVNELKKQGRITLEEFRDGFEYEITEVQALDDAGRQILEARLEAALKKAKTDQERAAAQAEYDTDIADGVYTVKTKRKFEGIPELTKDSVEWKGYLAIRDTMDRAAIQLLEANYANARAERVDLYEIASAAIGRDLTDTDRAFLNRAADRFITLRHEGATVNEDGVFVANQEAIDRAKEFIAKLNEALLGKDTDRHADAAAFFDAVEQQTFLDDIAAFKADSTYSSKKGQERFEIQRGLQNITMFDMSRADAQIYAKQSIAGSYVPLGREGRFQIRVQAIDPKTGEAYVVSERFKNQMVYMMTDGEGTANLIADDINKVLSGTGKPYQVEVVINGETVVKDVNLVARSEVATIGGFEGGIVNLNEVAHTLVRFGINLKPEERERLIIGLTEQNASARKRLRREGTPGYETGTMKYISRHLESIASTIARKEYRPYIDRLFVPSPSSNELWFGTQAGYDAAKAKFEALRDDPMANPQAVKIAAQEFDQYHLSFVTKKSQERGRDYQNQAQRLLSFMDSQRSVEFTDFSSGELGSQLRFWTVIAQLGGSFATGLLNIIALQTNVVPYLASYSSARAFGGGFGLARAQSTLLKAMKDVGLPKYSDLQTWKDIVADPDQIAAAGLTPAEAQFMLEEVSDGTFQAAQTNSMLGNARGMVTNAAGQKLTRIWMYFFNESEQAARRGAGLASFRLAYDRSMQAMEGRTDLTAQERQDLAYAEAKAFAVEAVDRTVGEYAMFNRPAMFRGDIRQFMFMYMMFPVTSILLMRNLSRSGKLLMLGTLLMLSGVKGLPFAEDLMDMVDTIAQMLGLGPSKVWRGSAERTLAEAIDEIAPGLTPIIMRGLVNQFIGINMADRISLGNPIPGTGMALAGSNTANELMEIFGPVAGFVDGLVGTTKSTVNYIAQTAGIAAGDTSFASLVRNGPFTMGRALGDMMAYQDTGAIVGLNGYVISRDLTPITYIGRALGFYPAAAVSENDVVRISRRVNDYTTEVSAMYRGMYISARLSNDPGRAQEVVQQVNAWNEAAKGSGMEIRNFVVNANRALREAERTTTERYRRTTPIASRGFTEDMIRIYGLDN